MVLGDNDGDRLLQWEMALPHIIANPVTGHGIGNSGEIVGYGGGGVFSVDSYPITLLVELGVPGLLLFYCMIGFAIWIGLRLYLTDMNEKAAVAGPLACSLVAFAAYRTALSQQENHTLVFMLVGLMLVVKKLADDRRIALQRSGRQNATQLPFGDLVPVHEIARTHSIANIARNAKGTGAVV
jgi:O-antigen ligase